MDPSLLFLPGKRVDITFDLDSDTPIVRSSVVYEFFPETQICIVSQPSRPFSTEWKSKVGYLSIIAYTNKRKVRYGLKCKIQKIVKDYVLSGKGRVSAIFLEYQLPIEELNLRSAYRINLGAEFDVKGKLIFNNESYFTGKDFKIDNLSATGLGLIVPKKKIYDSFINAKVGTEVVIGLVIQDINFKDKKNVVSAVAKVMRVEIMSDHALIGLKFEKMSNKDSEHIGYFVHNVQIYWIQKMRKYQ
ncbi:MAG: PilZ domain-containing protein [Desulfobacterales bacterium]|nr:PilZ domain-containing protein [Desulfobacterales bacterium]